MRFILIEMFFVDVDQSFEKGSWCYRYVVCSCVCYETVSALSMAGFCSVCLQLATKRVLMADMSSYW